jgi:hypothetical protein
MKTRSNETVLCESVMMNMESLQENCHFATGKLRLYDSSNCRNSTFATVPQPTAKCMSQRYFATVRKTVVTTVAKGIATVVTVAMCFFIFVWIALIGLQRQFKPSQMYKFHFFNNISYLSIFIRLILTAE